MPLASKSVVIKTLELPFLNSFIINSRWSWSMPPCRTETTKLSFRNFSARSSTYYLWLEKIMHCWISRFLYSSTRVKNFLSSLSMGMQNCLIPSKVSCSFFTRIVSGFLMNFLVISKIERGIVAEKSPTWMSAGMRLNIYLICSSNPWPNMLSASSKTISLSDYVRRICRFIISWTLPGVPTTIWTPS